MAMHLVNGIAASRNPEVPLIQATRHACAPFIGIADYRNKADRRYQWEASCIAFNDQVLELLKKEPTGRTVILSGNLYNYLKPGRLLVYRSTPNGDLWHDESHDEDVFKAVKTTIEDVRAMGHRVILITPPPRANFDVSRCLERRERSLMTFGGDPECGIHRDLLARENQKLNLFLNRIHTELKVSTLTFEGALCDGLMCKTTLDGIPLYRDDSHFSNVGGRALIQHMRLIDQIDQLAN